jgi:acylphosphatase
VDAPERPVVIPPPAERLTARVQGRVQGVGFRAFVVARGRALGLSGTVRNLPDGAVWVEAEGPRPILERLLAEIRQGPPASRVSGVEANFTEPTGLAGFEIGWS